MQEESKEDYIARHRREQGINVAPMEESEDLPEKKTTLKERLSAIFFLLLVAVFLWMIFMVFGMLKSN
jgi:hypothetical protein